jgi:hypothetical protein
VTGNAIKIETGTGIVSVTAGTRIMTAQRVIDTDQKKSEMEIGTDTKTNTRAGEMQQISTHC